MADKTAVITGALSYSGKFIAARLIDQGWKVKTITGHPDRPNPFGDKLTVYPMDFDDPQSLQAHMRNADVFFNTYWVRFERGDTTFDRAVGNSASLFDAASAAGVKRIVHISITKPSIDSPFPYFRGKAEVEQALGSGDVPHSIVRPTVVFGGGDVFVNNIAWIARWFPFFGLPPGDYRIRPVHVEDVAALCVAEASRTGNNTVDAVGPEDFLFHDFVRTIAREVNAWRPIIPVPAFAALGLSKIISLLVRDNVVTADELGGLMANLVTSDAPTTGKVVFTEWLRRNAATLGKRYESEVRRNFR